MSGDYYRDHRVPDYYQRDALERATVTKREEITILVPFRCDGDFRGLRCGQMIAELPPGYEPRASGPVVRCKRCGKKHTL